MCVFATVHEGNPLSVRSFVLPGNSPSASVLILWIIRPVCSREEDRSYRNPPWSRIEFPAKTKLLAGTLFRALFFWHKTLCVFFAAAGIIEPQEPFPARIFSPKPNKLGLHQEPCAGKGIAFSCPVFAEIVKNSLQFQGDSAKTWKLIRKKQKRPLMACFLCLRKSCLPYTREYAHTHQCCNAQNTRENRAFLHADPGTKGIHTQEHPEPATRHECPQSQALFSLAFGGLNRFLCSDICFPCFPCLSSSHTAQCKKKNALLIYSAERSPERKYGKIC